MGAWAVRVHYKPFVRWIWLGGIFIMIGGLLTLFDRRYRMVRAAKKQSEWVAQTVEASKA
jgi:cytochrome c-type biogenesis protein CcmF